MKLATKLGGLNLIITDFSKLIFFFPSILPAKEIPRD
jgi:hypothetical protein